MEYDIDTRFHSQMFIHQVELEIVVLQELRCSYQPLSFFLSKTTVTAKKKMS